MVFGFLSFRLGFLSCVSRFSQCTLPLSKLFVRAKNAFMNSCNREPRKVCLSFLTNSPSNNIHGESQGKFLNLWSPCKSKSATWTYWKYTSRAGKRHWNHFGKSFTCNVLLICSSAFKNVIIWSQQDDPAAKLSLILERDFGTVVSKLITNSFAVSTTKTLTSRLVISNWKSWLHPCGN